MPWPMAAEDHAEGGRDLALALAGVDDQQALLDRLGRHDLVARRLDLAHFLGVTGVVSSVMPSSSLMASPC